jgi:hypothetical protein
VFVDGVPSDVQSTRNVQSATNAQSTIPPLTRRTSRPFDEKSPAEKEELLERIAAQLADIGDLYEIEPPKDGVPTVTAAG